MECMPETGYEAGMRLRNGEHGYGAITKTLHWLTVAAIAAQFVVGWTMEADDPALELEKERIEQFEEQVEQQGDAAEELFESEIDRLKVALDAREDNYVAGAFTKPGISLPEVHVLLGLSIIVLALLRVLWRTTTPLPPWADHLSEGERRLEASLEKALLTLLFVVPGTGLLLIVVGDDWLPLHIAAQLVLLAAIALHVGLIMKHTIVRRHRHLARML
jgi:cytochrome b561